ncbi:HAD family hydrolase [Streptomyces fradiae]|uniref:HAD family hydrolase n=1 Tax=Streptomyces fradiae TaxID=1906 RepID=UPI00294282BF|nr:HAD-IA family hydrolase [Streptomyces fradiae]WOI61662.1 HAD-IA family hydrolase [Streptomyces fradiae]
MSSGTARSPVVPALRSARAVVFDTDGVLTDSARVHAAAWKEAFDAWLAALPRDTTATARTATGTTTGATDDSAGTGAAARRPFDAAEDYRRYVDGRSRLDGAATFLAARGLPADRAAVEAVAADKERRFTERLRARPVAAYPGSVRLLRALRGAGVPMAAASASRHAREVLAGAGLLDLFDALVDGVEAARLGLPGKPDPALFLEAARRLGVPPGRCALVEDALAGVEAGRRGGFAPVVGVDRAAGAGGAGTGAGTPTARALRRHGADLVVADLAELLAGREGEPA